jgi:hypothetical protein
MTTRFKSELDVFLKKYSSLSLADQNTIGKYDSQMDRWAVKYFWASNVDEYIVAKFDVSKNGTPDGIVSKIVLQQFMSRDCNFAFAYFSARNEAIQGPVVDVLSNWAEIICLDPHPWVFFGISMQQKDVPVCIFEVKFPTATILMPPNSLI